MSCLGELQTKLALLEEKLGSALNGFAAMENTTVETSSACCEQHGPYTQFKRKTDIFGHVFESQTECSQCLEAEILSLKAAINQAEKRQKASVIGSLKAKSGIAKRFINACFENYQASEQSARAKAVCRKYADVWQERKDVGGGLILCGKPGTGKSHLACAIANQVIEQHQDYVKITTALKITRDVKSTWHKDSETNEEAMIADYCSPDLLIIDEVGMQFGSDAEKMILFEVLNERYEQMKSTILISNLSQNELDSYVGERVVDRMREGGGAIVCFEWASFRR